MLRALGLIPLLLACSTRPTIVEPAASVPFESRWLLATCDVDMAGQAYADGRLVPLEGERDALVIIDPGGGVRSVPASNSVISWPAVLATSRDGRFGIVVESRGPAPVGIEEMDDVWEDFPEGRQLTIVDLETAKVAFSGDSMALDPRSVAVHPQTGQLAMPSRTGHIVLTRLDEMGRPSETLSLDTPQAWLAHGAIESLEWHPTEPAVVANLGNTHLAIGTIDGDRVRSWGEPLALKAWLTAGSFTHDGAYFLIPDVGWGEGSAAFVTNRRGRLLSVRFDRDGAHELVSEATVGLSPEGFALSPDGRFAVTVNMRRTYLGGGFPQGMIRGRGESSLSLVRVAPNGTLTTVGEEAALHSVLPEDAVFDRTSRTLAVTGYHGFEDEPSEGWVELWRIVDEEGGPQLRPTDVRWPTPRGAHDLAMVP